MTGKDRQADDAALPDSNPGWELLNRADSAIQRMAGEFDRAAILLLLDWARSAEWRLQRDAEQPDQAPQCPPARPIDANTEALIQADEQRETKPCPCGGTSERKGQQLVCGQCGRAARVKAAPQSAWVPDQGGVAEYDQLRGDEVRLLREEVEEARKADADFRACYRRHGEVLLERDEARREAEQLREQNRELQAKLAAAEATIENLRRDLMVRDTEIENLRIANELQKPAERSAFVQDVVNQMRRLMAEVAYMNSAGAAGSTKCVELARRLHGAIRDCLPLGPHRIEFGVQEVLP